jgi:hypothetical protein
MCVFVKQQDKEKKIEILFSLFFNYGRISFFFLLFFYEEENTCIFVMRVCDTNPSLNIKYYDNLLRYAHGPWSYIRGQKPLTRKY